MYKIQKHSNKIDNVPMLTQVYPSLDRPVEIRASAVKPEKQELLLTPNVHDQQVSRTHLDRSIFDYTAVALGK